MGAITTTLNLNGNMGNRLAALQRRAEMLYASMQKLGNLNVSPPRGFDTFTNPLQESEIRGINTTMALRQSLLELNKVVAGVRGACAEATNGIRNIGNVAQETNRQVSSLATSLNTLPKKLNPPTISTQPANAMRTLGQSAESFRVATENACRSCAMLSKGIRDIELSATKANRQVNTFSSSLKAFPTTLNFKFNGNPEAKIAKIQTGVESLKKSINGLKGTNISTPQSFSTYTTPLQQSVASAIGTVRTLRQSMLDLNKAVTGTRGACAEAANGIRNISNSAQEANRRVGSLATNLNRLNRVRLPNLNTLSNNSAYAVLGNMSQSLTASLDRVNSSLSRTNSALNSFNSSASRTNSAINDLGSSANRTNSALSGTGGASASASRGIRNVGNAAQEAARHTSSLVASLMAAWAVYGTFHAGRSLMETSDKITNIEGRMMVGIDEGAIKEAKAYLQKNMEAVPIGMTLDEAALQGSVAQYKKRIMDIANETRQTFTDTAGFISKLMVNVGGKAFKTTSELLDFTKTLNKFIVVSGASGSEATSILTQLPQALSSGNLQGDELRSIRENAPLLKNVIQDYANKVLGLQGDIKDLGAQGQITARTVVDAVKWGSNIADEKLGKMPWTWAQRWNTFSNQVIVALEPVFDKIKQLANMEGTGKMFTDMANVVANLAGGIVKIATVFMALGTALSNIGLL